jgi:flagellar biosynthesis anti-sigma factor FlgM
MKIQGERPDEITATPTVSSNRGVRADAPGTAPEPTTDRIEVSSDARFLSTAVQAANNAPEIRTELVERAKALMASGELGSNVERLADRMIDHMMRL